MTLSIQPLNLRCWSNYGCSHYCYVLPMKHLKSLNNLIKELGVVTLTTWSSKSTGCLHNRWARYISIRTGMITWKWIFGQIASLTLIFLLCDPKIERDLPLLTGVLYMCKVEGLVWIVLHKNVSQPFLKMWVMTPWPLTWWPWNQERSCLTGGPYLYV